MKKFIPVGAVLVFLLLVGLGAFLWRGQEGGASSHTSESQSEGASVNSIWVSHTAKASVLDEIFQRHDEDEVVEIIKEYSDEIIESLGRDHSHAIDAHQVLLDSGAVFESGGEIRAQTDVGEWETGGSGPSEMEVSEALSIALEVNVVDWCGERVNGDSFAREYYFLENDHFETREEAKADIERHVQCGSEGSS